MKKLMRILLLTLIALFGLSVCAEAEGTARFGDETEMVGPGPKGKKNKATYGRSQGTYQPKSFYSGRKAPKKKSSKNMPSATRHIG